jgi:hypothetical protein
MGIDGEGIRVEPGTPQPYMLLRAGEHELYTGERLTTAECLDFICDLPAKPLLIGFAFGYDATQILRDLPAERLSNAVIGNDGTIIKRGTGIFDDKKHPDSERRGSPYTYWGNFGIEYLPKNYLRVCRLERIQVKVPATPKREESWHSVLRPVPDSVRTIYETFGFFQKAFLHALRDFDIGVQHHVMIEKLKSERAEFNEISTDIRVYCALECELLAEMMEKFRSLCHANGLFPKTWNGAGKLAAVLHAEFGTMTAEEVKRVVPDSVLAMASEAYYGGRFEVIRIGEIDGPVYQADIVSAYPAAMPKLPCLRHGTWQPFKPGEQPTGLYIAKASFTHPEQGAICGLPIRRKDGRLFWPRQGSGVYWSPEIRSARRLGAKVKLHGGFRYLTNCQCGVFDWVEPLFEKRRKLGKDTLGYPLKLGSNSLYGKLAQRIGNPRYANMIWAGLITALTRAALNDAARRAPDDVIMFATDAVFSKSRLKLKYGEGLGQWELEEYPRLFVAQPGIYFGAKRPKTRGIPTSVFREYIPRFERIWRLWATGFGFGTPPEVRLPIELFTGLRLAHARGKPETAGTWASPKEGRRYSFDWSRKRDPKPIWETPLCVRTRPADGIDPVTGQPLRSVPHSANAAWINLDQERQELDDQPDPLDLSPVV